MFLFTCVLLKKKKKKKYPWFSLFILPPVNWEAYLCLYISLLCTLLFALSREKNYIWSLNITLLQNPRPNIWDHESRCRVHLLLLLLLLKEVFTYYYVTIKLQHIYDNHVYDTYITFFFFNNFPPPYTIINRFLIFESVFFCFILNSH